MNQHGRMTRWGWNEKEKYMCRSSKNKNPKAGEILAPVGHRQALLWEPTESRWYWVRGQVLPSTAGVWILSSEIWELTRGFLTKKRLDFIYYFHVSLCYGRRRAWQEWGKGG